ncbi:hypothetical protein HRbin17_00575 [bacterium HR17]|uniref:Glycoside hydrolase family 42 N-terminal domain-containing protein n=1 Tax=Candidatus Fervidibacter japonicus TaxID=2035412 RepID=A0A2H5XA59_9BACT|nr:hypothetical protein HRbin17_00575 [bacterium HR17]
MQTKMRLAIAIGAICLVLGFWNIAVASPAVWVEIENGHGHTAFVTSPNASGGKRIGWFGTRGQWVAVDVALSQTYHNAVLHLRYSRGHSDAGPLEVLVASPSATQPEHPEVKRLGQMLLRPTGSWDHYRWASLPLGELPTGRYRLFFVCPKDGGAGDLDVACIVDDATGGLWEPPNKVIEGKLIGEGRLKPPVEILQVICPEPGNLFLSNEVLGKGARPVQFTLQLRNNLIKVPVQVTISASVSNDHGLIARPQPHTVQLPPRAERAIDYCFKAPGFGWFEVVFVAQSGGKADKVSTAFCILHPPAKGVRPNSFFGMGIGDSDDDLLIAERIGVKWRRGIPETDTEIVAPEPNKRWGEKEIQRARDIVQRWAKHGVLCLGYVNYNPSWNVMPDPLGRPISRHQNRPKDLAAHADVVYHLIKPLADLVKHWELWNEPWIHGWTWRTGDAQDYRDMTRLIWDRIKSEMPDVMLIGGGSTPYLRDIVYAKGSENAGYIDGSATHPYGVPDRSLPSVTALEAVMNRLWSKGKGKGGIWATEVGTAEFFFNELPERERPFMVARTVAPIYLLLRLGAGDTPIKVFWFASQYNRAFAGGEHNIWDGTNPKPAVAAFSAMTHFLEDAHLLGDIYQSAKIGWALHFVKPDGTSVVAFWLETGTAGEHLQGSMHLPLTDAAIYDYLGRPIGKRTANGWLIPIRTWEVRYVVTKAPATKVRVAFLQAKFSGVPIVFVNPRSFPAPLSLKPPLRVKVENLLPRHVQVNLTVQPPTGWRLAQTQFTLRLQAGDIRFVTVPLLAVQPNTVNRYPLRYRATAEGIKHEGVQVVQVACANYGTPKVDGDLSDWQDAIPVTMVARGSRDYLRAVLNPNLVTEALSGKRTGVVIYRLWTRWDEHHFYLAAEIPDDNFVSNTTFEDDPYAFPFYADCLQLAFDCVERNPDDLLFGHPLYEKAMAADVDYEFCATLARMTGEGPSYDGKPPFTGDRTKCPHVPELYRLKAPGTNFQTFYPTNAPLNPPIPKMRASAEGGPEGQVAIVYDYTAKVFRYEIALPWSCLQELAKQVRKLRQGQWLTTHFAWAVHDAGGLGRTFWQQEAGDVQPGSYGFSPHWGGGRREYGGRIITDWGFAR